MVRPTVAAARASSAISGVMPTTAAGRGQPSGRGVEGVGVEVERQTAAPGSANVCGLARPMRELDRERAN